MEEFTISIEDHEHGYRAQFKVHVVEPGGDMVIQEWTAYRAPGHKGGPGHYDWARTKAMLLGLKWR